MGGFLDQVGNAIGGALPTIAGYAIGGVPGAIIGSSISGGLAAESTNSANAAIMAQNNQFNAEQAQLNRDWSANQAWQQMDFQRANMLETQTYNDYEASTQYQRAVKDMEAAGLSPMLAYMKGGNAAPSSSAPSGAMGSSSAASASSAIPMQNPVLAAATSANVAADTANKLATKDLINSQISLTDNQTNLTAEQADQVRAAAAKIRAEIPKIEGDTNFEVQQEILKNTARLIYQQGTAANSQSLGQESQAQVNVALIKKLVSETDLNKLDLRAAADMGNLGREAGQLAPIIQMIINTIRLSRSH